MVDMNTQELLNFAVLNGILDLHAIHDSMEKITRDECLKKHPYSIWQNNNDGRWYTYFPGESKNKSKRKLKSKKTREELEKLICEYWKIELDNPTIDELFEQWINRRVELKKICLATKLRYQQEYDRFYKDFGKRHIKSVTKDEYVDFLERQPVIHEISAKRFSSLKTITKGFLMLAKKKGYIDYNGNEVILELDTSESSFHTKIKSDEEEVYNEEETEVVFRYLRKYEDSKNLAVYLLFISGIRIGELITLKHEDIDLVTNTIKIRRTATKYKIDEKVIYDVKEFPKTKAGIRTVIIPDNYHWLLEKIVNIAPEEEYVFWFNGHRMTIESVRHRMYNICDKFGFVRKSCHKARKTYASILLDNGIDKNLTTNMLGHVDISTTENHYHRNRKTLDNRKKIINNIPEFSSN